MAPLGFPGSLPFTRREFVRGLGCGAALAGAGIALPSISLAGNPVAEKLFGLSSFGELKYTPQATHFDYAWPDAPKGGRFAFSPSYWYFNQNTQTFNTLNSFVLKGEAPPRMELCFDTLMTWAIDEPDTLYCALAKSVEISQDRNSYRFELRPEARFHDGSPVTAADVVFSYLTIKEKGHPQLSVDLVELVDVAEIDRLIVELRFSGMQSDRAILSVANSVPILSKPFYHKLGFENHVMEVPLGSGSWKVGKFSAGSFIEYDRVHDYWGKDLFFARGLDHFDTLRIDFFRERQAGFEAFKKGEVRWREEFTSKTWATEYNFPAVEEGKVIKVEISGETRPSLQGWAVNTRREKFNDARTREAIALAFDFNWTNKNLFYGAYERSHSMFEKSDYAASGLPTAGELALLEPLRSQLPESVFGEAVRQFDSDGSGKDRIALRRARELLGEAGWKHDGNGYVDGRGNNLEFEFLIGAQVFERILGPFVENLKSIGVPASIRLVDPSQFQARLEEFDFDIAGLAFSFGVIPTRESMKQFFQSDEADRTGSNNYPGIKLAALDQLIDKIDAVNSREELQTVMKAIDRVLRAHYFWIPNWFAPNHRIALWDMFDWKAEKPDYFFPVERLWWFNKEKAAALEQ
jgi:microcin C transport system substrate-binding protein